MIDPDCQLQGRSSALRIYRRGRLKANHEADNPGAKGSFTLLVQPEHLAKRFKDAILPPVFATPVMIMVMESAALNAMRAYLDPGESAVGTAVNVRHLVATPVGRLVSGGRQR